jgi:hypothetical protein
MLKHANDTFSCLLLQAVHRLEEQAETGTTRVSALQEDIARVKLAVTTLRTSADQEDESITNNLLKKISILEQQKRDLQAQGRRAVLLVAKIRRHRWVRLGVD